MDLWRGTPFTDLETPWLASMRTALELEQRSAQLDRTDVALHRATSADRHPRSAGPATTGRPPWTCSPPSAATTPENPASAAIRAHLLDLGDR